MLPLSHIGESSEAASGKHRFCYVVHMGVFTDQRSVFSPSLSDGGAGSGITRGIRREPELRPPAGIDPVSHAPARLMTLSYIYVIESVDYVFLMRLTGLTWCNLSTHLSRLEDAGYVTRPSKRSSGARSPTP